MQGSGTGTSINNGVGMERGRIEGGDGTPGKEPGGPAVTEISDKDYRSFCWPCYALDEEQDGTPDK